MTEEIVGAAIEVIQKSVETLVTGYEGKLPEMDISRATLVVLLIAIAAKICLWIICSRIAAQSPSADALAQVRPALLPGWMTFGPPGH